MSVKKRGKEKEEKERHSFRDLLALDYLLICRDVLIGTGTEISFIRTVETIHESPPVTPASLFIVMSFWNKIACTPAEFKNQGLEVRITLINPSKKKFDLGIHPIAGAHNDGSSIQRLIMDMGNALTFNSIGPYVFLFEGRANNGDFCPLGYKMISIRSDDPMPRKLISSESGQQRRKRITKEAK